MFQFHFGSIGSRDQKRSCLNLRCFNSTLVRLEVNAQASLRYQDTRFNSTLVRLEAKRLIPPAPLLLRFNSTLVRLEVVWNIIVLYFLKFQFHFGSIGSQDLTKKYCSYLRFNSALVRLEASQSTFRSIPAHSFNSTLVRLEAGNVYFANHREQCFNSTLVRLEGRKIFLSIR